MDRFDVIVVGCGPAGASAARSAALSGRQVMIVDRRRSVGVPARCAGYVPRWLRYLTGFDDGAVLQNADGIRLIAADGRRQEIPAPGFILDRARFDKTLAIHALEAGADLANALVLGRKGGSVIIRRNGIEAAFSSEAIVGADGPASIIGRSMFAGRVTQQRFMATLQYEVGLRTPEAWAEYYLLGKDGTGWFVPCGRTAHIGVGVWQRRARRLRGQLKKLMSQLSADGRVYTDSILGATGGLVPVSRPGGPTCTENSLLAGDAGSMSEPFSGAGIAAAVVSGDVAGAAAAEVAAGNREAMLDYGSTIRSCLPKYEGGPADDLEQIAARVACVAEWTGTIGQPQGA